MDNTSKIAKPQCDAFLADDIDTAEDDRNVALSGQTRLSSQTYEL
jgi:hypothetical protein